MNASVAACANDIADELFLRVAALAALKPRGRTIARDEIVQIVARNIEDWFDIDEEDAKC